MRKQGSPYRVQRRQKSSPRRLPDSKLNFLFEHCSLTVVTVAACVAAVVWIVAISTDYWIIVVGGPDGILLDVDHEEDHLHDALEQLRVHHGAPIVFLWSHSGLWRRCDIFTVAENVTLVRDGSDANYVFGIDPNPRCHAKQCFDHPLYDLTVYNDGGLSPNLGKYTYDFVQTRFTLVLITFVLIILAVGFSIYALIHPRYTYKMLAATLHGITAILQLVLNLLMQSESQVAQHDVHPKVLQQSRSYAGFSYLLAFLALWSFSVQGFVFLLMSKRRKNLLYDSEVILK